MDLKQEKKKDCRNQQKIKSNIPLDKKWTVNSIRDHHERVLLKEVDTYRLWLFDWSDARSTIDQLDGYFSTGNLTVDLIMFRQQQQQQNKTKTDLKREKPDKTTSPAPSRDPIQSTAISKSIQQVTSKHTPTPAKPSKPPFRLSLHHFPSLLSWLLYRRR